MHEVGVAEGIIKRVLDVAAENNAVSVKTIGLKIGSFSGVEPRSLEFALECLKADTLAKDSKVDIEFVIANGVCAECGKSSSPGAFLSVCTHCGSPLLEIVSGKEFEISYIDIED